jgi:hypothetical protein
MYEHFHYHIDKISRKHKDKKRQHIVLGAAYRAGEPLYDERQKVLHDKHKDRTDVIHKEILLPSNAPLKFLNRETLWNEVEATETYRNARTARDIEFFLSNKIPIKSQIQAAREHIIENFVNLGMCADMCVHDDGSGRPHVHLLLTTRIMDENGNFTTKNREWDKRINTTSWRSDWDERMSYEYERLGLTYTGSHKSYKERGIDREPTKFVHRGLYKNGIQTERVLENEAIKERNNLREAHREIDRYRDNDRDMTRDYD